MQSAKQAVSEFLHHGNRHSVDIEQETKPVVVHETVAQKQHEDVTQAVDREIHQHHHQIHVQPIKEKVVEEEKHHQKIIPIENRTTHHGRDQAIATTLAQEYGRFKDEQQTLPVQVTNSTNVVVGEHVHHHVHDYIQPVVERERIVPHVVHTIVPIHEHIEHQPIVHKGNVLPTMTMEEFTKAGHSLKGSTVSREHIEYEGKPLDIDDQSHVGFSHHGLAAATAGAGAGAYTHTSKPRSRSSSISSSDEEDMSVPRSMGKPKKRGIAPHKSKLLNKLDPRVDSKVEEARV